MCVQLLYIENTNVKINFVGGRKQYDSLWHIPLDYYRG